MTFKTGALVILTSADAPNCKHLIGQIHVLGGRSKIFAQSWMLEGVIDEGMTVSWHERHMRILGNPGDDAVDETLLRLPSPRQEVTA